MHTAKLNWIWIALLLLSGQAYAQAIQSVEVPIGKTGEVQVAEIVSRLARASGVALERPAANLTLIDPGARPRVDEDVALRDAGPRSRDHVPARHDGHDGRRPDSGAGASRGVAAPARAIWPTAPARPRANGSPTGCAP